MKGSISFGMIAVAVLAIAVLAGSGVLPLGSVTVPIDGKQCQLVEGDYATIECALNEPDVFSQVSSFSGDYRTTSAIEVFGDYENGPSGDYYVFCRDADRFAFQVSGISGDFATSPYQIGEQWGYMHVNPNQYTNIFSLVKPGEKIRIGGCFNDLIATQQFTEGYLAVRYDAYGLRIESDTGADYWYDESTCNLQYATYTQTCETGENCEYPNIYGSTLPFNAFVNFLVDYEPVSVDSAKVIDYNGQKALCEFGPVGEMPVFSLSDYVTESGACYATPDMIIGYVECCGDMYLPQLGVYCKDNEVQDIPVEPDPDECTKPCTFTTQCQAIWGYDYTTPELDMIREECIAGCCEIVDRKTVECETTSDCQDGYCCKNGDCVECAGPAPVCGDGVCQTQYEDYNNCPADCDSPLQRLLASISVFLSAFIVGTIVTGTGLFILRIIPQTRLVAAPILASGRMIVGIALLGGIVLGLFFTVPMLTLASLI